MYSTCNIAYGRHILFVHIFLISILYYTILYYTILYYTLLYCTVLCCAVLYYTILYYTLLYYTILYATILYILLSFTFQTWNLPFSVQDLSHPLAEGYLLPWCCFKDISHDWGRDGCGLAHKIHKGQGVIIIGLLDIGLSVIRTISIYFSHSGRGLMGLESIYTENHTWTSIECHRIGRHFPPTFLLKIHIGQRISVGNRSLTLNASRTSDCDCDCVCSKGGKSKRFNIQ